MRVRVYNGRMCVCTMRECVGLQYVKMRTNAIKVVEREEGLEFPRVNAMENSHVRKAVEFPENDE